jgi:tetratricopeptide (TPR) repeat protein
LWLTACVSSHRAAAPHPSTNAKPSEEPPWPAEKLAAAHAHYGAGVIHDMNGESEAALKEYREAVVNDPSDEALVLEVSRRYVQAKDFEKALEVLNLAAARPNASGAIFARLGIIYSQAGKPDQAIIANRTAIKKSPAVLAGYQNLYLAYLQKKQPLEALKVLDEAAGAPRSGADFLLSLSELYINFALQASEQKPAAHAKARALLDRAEKLNPSSPSQKLQLAEGFNALGDYEKAAQLYLDLLKKLPDVPLIRERVHARLTDIYLRGEDRKRAAEQLHAIVRDDPTNPQAYYWLGNIALEDKKPQEALDYFNRCLLLNQDFEQAYYDLAMTQINLNKPGEALGTLEKARKKFSTNFMVEFWTAMAFVKQEAYKEAIRHFTEAEVIARANEPKRINELFFFQFGAACERSGDYTQAEKYFQKCIEAAPNFADALNYLGYMWAERGLKLEQARELIEKAVKIEPKNSAYLDSLAWVLYKLNQPKEALNHILKAAELSEEPDATIYEHLGDIYAALKETEKAREAWRKSLSLKPSDPVRAKLGVDSAK